MELAKDLRLFQAMRKEVLTAWVTDRKTQKRTLDIQKLLALPLLQSVFTEVLRLHVSFNITREIIEPITLEGYQLEKGSLLQAPSEIAHYDEAVWSAEGHPASEFWAARHLKPVDTPEGEVSQFSMAGRSNEFFPFGTSTFANPAKRSVAPVPNCNKRRRLHVLGPILREAGDYDDARYDSVPVRCRVCRVDEARRSAFGKGGAERREVGGGSRRAA